MKQPAVYIIGNNRPTLYIGVTSDLLARIYQHRSKLGDGFSTKYGLTKLLYYELHESMSDAILREKQMKKWNRDWKLRIVRELHPGFIDLYDGLFDSRLRGNDKEDFGNDSKAQDDKGLHVGGGGDEVAR